MKIDNFFIVDLLIMIFIIISFIIGLKIIYKYQENKRKTFITVGLAWIFYSASWWNDMIKFIISDIGGIMYTEQDNYLVYLLTVPLSSIAMIFWIYSFCEMTYPNWKKRILLIYLPIAILSFIRLFFLYNENSFLITILFIISDVILGIFIITFIITGYLFFEQTRKSDLLNIRWKGRFLLIAFISFTVGSSLEMIFDIFFYEFSGETIFLLYYTITRIILISSAIEYYLGFFIPKRLLRFLMKKEESLTP